ncbi:MAG TPA: LysR family transcriptional regulator [Chthonomonadaceae bacterium]|nr:LysR family transcriptional regulator [Chthonomonadaceae bacterium]
MELRRLHSFIAVAEELHFGRAAQRLCLAQPALSRQIQQLERELGVLLFERMHHRVALTQAGEVFLEEVRQGLAQLEKAAQAARETGRGHRGQLKVGFTAATMYRLLPQIIRTFQERFPHAEVTFTEVYSGQQPEQLHEKRIDVGFALSVSQDERLCVEPVWKEPLVAVLPRNHPLAVQVELALSDLAEEPFVLFPRPLGPGLYDQILQFCQRAGFQPRTTHEAAPQRTIITVVGTGAGVSLIPAGLQAIQDPGVVYRPFRPPVPEIEFAVMWRQEDTSPLLHNFLTVVRQTTGSVIGRAVHT